MIRPLVNPKMAVDLARKIFDLRVPASLSIKELDSYEDRNFYIRGSLPFDKQEREYALKVSKYGESEKGGILDELSNVMFHLHNNGISCSIPQPTVHGKLYEMKEFATTPTAKQSNETRPEYCGCTVRLLSYVPGEMIRAIPCSLSMFYQVGRFAAKVDKVLEDFECPLLETRKLFWDLDNFHAARKARELIQDPYHLQLLRNIEENFATKIEPKLDSLPKQCIHADINDGNVIFKQSSGSAEYKPSGLIDFELSNHNSRVFEVAVSAAYMMALYLGNPLEAGAYTVAGYQARNPLSTAETELIFDLIQVRLYQMVCSGTRGLMLQPENWKYLMSYVQIGWRVLEILAQNTSDEFQEKWNDVSATFKPVDVTSTIAASSMQGCSRMK